MASLNVERMFPCPICAIPCDVRMTKKRKPYITCDPCGIQLFVRGPAGITAFNRLVEHADREGLWARLREMDRHYHLKCPACGRRFWIGPDLAKTSLFDGTLQGFRCPERNCREVVPWETTR